MKTYLEFYPVKDTGKTKVWSVRNSVNENEKLGEVRWRTGWRRYIFRVENSGMEFDSECLSEIQTFINYQMEIYQMELRKKPPN